MSFIKQIFNYPFVKKFFAPKTIIFILLGLGIAFFLYKYFKKRREDKLKEAQEKPAEKKLTPTTLLKIWKEFLRQIPREFRYSIHHYQPVIVFGEAGSGKTQIIDNYTDWQGQSYQFYPSYKADPDLQIYLGSRAVVQEIPSPLLNDVSNEARKALFKLWRVSLRKGTPIIIIVLNAATLAQTTPQATKKQAQMIRGKINIISAIMKKPVKVRIVLTHMDQLPGYKEFSDFLDKQQIPLQIELGEKPTESELRDSLVPYEKYLPLALTTLSSEGYQSCLEFLLKAPDTFSSFSFFLQSLTEHAPLSYELKLESLYLTSDTTKEGIVHPFSASWGEDIYPSVRQRLRFHRAACLTISVLGTGYMGFAFYHDRNVWHKTYTAMEQFRENPSPELEELARTTIIELVQHKKDTIELFLPSFFSRTIKNRTTTAIRNFYILPQLASSHKITSPEKLLYMLSLLYASNNNELGKLIIQRLEEWEKNLGISQQIITVYITNSEYGWNNYSIPLTIIPSFKDPSAPAKDLRPWNRFFRKIRYAYQEPVLRPSLLKELQEDTKPLEEAIHQVRSYYSAKEILDLLKKEVPKLEIGQVYLQVLTELDTAQWISRDGKELISFITMINNSQTSDLPSIKEMTLRDLTNELKIIYQPVKIESKGYQFKLKEEQFSFSSEKWVNLVRDSRTILLLQRFAIYHKQYFDSQMFFRKYSNYPDIVMNPYNNGSFQFTGKANIDGRYTMAAYKNELKPTLEELEMLLSHDFDKYPQALPLHRKAKDYFTNFIFQEIQKYAANYKKHWDFYYEQFDVKAESLGSLKDIMTLMQLPVSPFQDFLQNLVENTAFEKSASPFVPPLYENLQGFQYINRLLVDDKKNFPELDKYKAILRQILAELKGESSGAEKPQKEKEQEQQQSQGLDEFDKQLSPLGRLSLNIFLERQESYLKLAKSWLDSVGIVGHWQKPFLTPIHELYRLGQSDIETAIVKNWERKILPVIEPVVSKFPLRPEGFTDISPSLLEETLHPVSGNFSKAFKDYIAPVCVEQNNTWALKETFQGRIKTPDKMFETVTRLTKISKLLWDKEGNPQKIILSIQPQTLPEKDKKDETDKPAVLAYLKYGKSAVFSFNQRSDWYKFDLEWWLPQVAIVGIQFEDPATGQKSFEEIVIPETPWSFFKILKKGQPLAKNVWAWDIAGENNIAKKVKFLVAEGLWKILFPTKDEAGE